MISPDREKDLAKEIDERVTADRALLDKLRAEIRPLRDGVRKIQPRSTTSISLVGTDGGNNKLQFDPFLIQIIRVVDSSENEYCLEAVTPTTSVVKLSEKQFGPGKPTALGDLMTYLGVKTLPELSHMIRSNDEDKPTSPTWIQVYRELVEWAILFSLVRNKDFGTDTLIVFDGLLRSKVFSGDLFRRYLQGMEEGIDKQFRDSKRRIYLAGVAKHSQVLSRYRLAMMLESIMQTDYPVFMEIPREIEEKAYVWSEYARGDDRMKPDGELNKFVGGKMFFVKFGNGKYDPIWPVDIFLPQSPRASDILGSMLADAINGFPVPFYPLCLQKAHENAAMVDFDFEILQDHIFDSIRKVLGAEGHTVDVFRLQDSDPARHRYDK